MKGYAYMEAKKKLQKARAKAERAYLRSQQMKPYGSKSTFADFYKGSKKAKSKKKEPAAAPATPAPLAPVFGGQP